MAFTPHKQEEVQDTDVRQKIDEHKLVIKEGLRKIAPTILRSLHEHKLIGDKEHQRLKAMNRSTQLDALVFTIGNKDRQQFEVFRDIVKHHKQTALYIVLDIEKNEKTEKGSEQNDLKDIKDELRRNSKKTDDVMAAVRRMEKTQAEEVKMLKEKYDLKQQEVDTLKAKISNLEKELKHNQDSKIKIKLEKELKLKKALEVEVQSLQKRITDLESSDMSNVHLSSDEIDL